MGSEIQIPSYVWKETIEFKYKKELHDKIVSDYVNHSKSDKFKFKFNKAKTSAFMKNFYDEDIPVILDKEKIFINELSFLIKNFFNNYLKFYNINSTFFISKMWYCLYENDMETLSHIHDDGSHFSGLYYLKFDKKSDNTTFFQNTHFNKYLKKEIIFEPDLDENDLLFFPSGYSHGSKRHTGNDYRIVIAFDIFCNNFSNNFYNFQKKPKLLYN